MEWLKKIYFLPLLFKFKAEEEVLLPAYKGATFRGGFGYTFKKSVCALKSVADCKDCLLSSNCAYAYVFETPRPKDAQIMRKYEHVPHPFVLCPTLSRHRLVKAGECLEVEMVLIGKAIEYLPYFILVMDELGKAGLGKHRGKCTLQGVSVLGKEVFNYEEAKIKKVTPLSLQDLKEVKSDKIDLSLNFVTPLKLQRNSKIIRENLTFQDIFRSLLRRISLLAYFHCKVKEDELEVEKFSDLITKSQEIKVIEDKTIWVNLSRFSTRQKQKIPIGGLVGKISFTGDISSFWPFLVLGEYLHVGKNTSVGLGKYIIN